MQGVMVRAGIFLLLTLGIPGSNAFGSDDGCFLLFDSKMLAKEAQAGIKGHRPNESYRSSFVDGDVRCDVWLKFIRIINKEEETWGLVWVNMYNLEPRGKIDAFQSEFISIGGNMYITLKPWPQFDRAGIVADGKIAAVPCSIMVVEGIISEIQLKILSKKNLKLAIQTGEVYNVEFRNGMLDCSAAQTAGRGFNLDVPEKLLSQRITFRAGADAVDSPQTLVP
jgi:hypothetical protein